MKPMTNDYLPKVIADQAKFLNAPPEGLTALYNELTTMSELRGLILVEDIGDPDRILRSANFQYLVKGKNVQIINKYF